MIKIGIIGEGADVDIYIEHLISIEAYQLVGFYGVDTKKSNHYAKKYISTAFYSAKEISSVADCFIVFSDDVNYVELSKQLLRLGKHLFCDKALTASLDDYTELMNIAKEANAKYVVGLVDRFNPAFQCIKSNAENPLFIETSRLIHYKSNEQNSSVIVDLMFHDIDLILALAKSEIKRISATGVKVLSDSADIANARLEFSNGCVANLTVSRVAMIQKHTLKLYQRASYFDVDLMEQQCDKLYFKQHDTDSSSREIIAAIAMGESGVIAMEKIAIQAQLPIRQSLEHFNSCILGQCESILSAHEGYLALDASLKVLKKVNTFGDE